MSARMVIRDVARALDLPYAEADRLAKMIPNELHITIKRAMEENRELRELYEGDENIRKLQHRPDIHILGAEKSSKLNNSEEKEIEEKMDITQGKLVIGTDVNLDEEDSGYKISLYNVILGEKEIVI